MILYKKIQIVLVGVICLVVSAVGQAATVANPKERIDYWRNNYHELASAADPRVATAFKIFERVLSAAGRRSGVHPRLHILAEDPLNISLPISIPDGWIILSKSVLDLCYEDGKKSEDKLAFVLAHEISHLYDDDFWHINFFNALDLSKRKGLLDPAVLAEIADIIGETDKVAKKELRADEKGIIITSMAGYDVRAIVNKDGSDNFFKKWEDLISVNRLSNAKTSNRLHPTSKQRSVNILTQLQNIAENSQLFRLGLIFYQSGNFPLAIDAFNEFLHQYPGREVYHNLAASHHQLALSYKQQAYFQTNELPFKLSIALDPITRAYGSIFRGIEQQAQSFKKNIEAAINYYKEAVEQDPRYILAYTNLASAYVQNGQPFKAVALLQDAIHVAPSSAVVHNILGAAYYQTGNVNKAIGFLNRSARLDTGYADPLFNLGKIAHIKNKALQAKSYWLSYLKLDPDSNWAVVLRKNYHIGKAIRTPRGLAKQHYEKIFGLQVGNYRDEIPESWGPSTVKMFPLRENPHQVAQFNNGVTTIAEGDEIRLMVAEETYKGKSNLGLQIGSARSAVISTYGVPSLQIKTSQGTTLLYPEKGITFQLRDQQVVSWLVY